MAGNSAEPARSVISKINAILVTVIQGTAHSMTEIARASDLPLSTAHRLTSELASSRLLERTADGRYRPGTGAADDQHNRNRRVDSERAGARRAGGPVRVTKARVRLGMLDGPNISYIEKQPGHCLVTSFTPAATLPVHPTAVSCRAGVRPAHAVESMILRGHGGP